MQILKKNEKGTITNAIPGVFFYYTKVVAPSANFTINVYQSKVCNSFKYFEIHQKDDIKLFGSGCVRFNNPNPSQPIIGKARLVVIGATPVFFVKVITNRGVSVQKVISQK